MSQMKQFKSAGRKAHLALETYEFEVDDHKCTSIKPEEGLLVMLMAAQGSEIKNDSERVASMIDASMSLFDQDTRSYVQRRLLDPKDRDFDFEFLMEIVQGVVEEWTDRPTKPSSDSTSSSENGGTSSTEDSRPAESTSLVST